MTWKENLQMMKDFVEMSINPDTDFDKYYKSRSRITLQIRDVDEIISEKTIPVKTHHVGMWGTIQSNFAQPGQSNMRVRLIDFNGNVNLNAGGQQFEIETTSGNSNRGIIAGRGSSVIDLTDFEMETKITEGTGTNQFNYQATVISALTNPVSGEWSFTIDRDMINNSGATILVEEVGYYFLRQNTDTYLADLVEQN